MRSPSRKNFYRYHLLQILNKKLFLKIFSTDFFLRRTYVEIMIPADKTDAAGKNFLNLFVLRLNEI